MLYISVFGSLSETLVRNLSSGKRVNIVCDVLEQNEKQFLCDKVTQRMIEYYYGNVFVTFVEPDDNPPPVPQMVDLNDPYSCKNISIKDTGIIGMAKRMFWCKSKLYIKGGTLPPLHHHMAGFFIASSRETEGRVFVFRTAEPTDRSVYAVGELDNVSLILGKVAGVPAIDDSPPTSPSSSASSELF